MYCSVCGKEIVEEATICPGCGCMVKNNSGAPSSNAPIILGIVGIVFAWLFALVGHITSIIGIVLGVKEYKNNGKVAGLVLSIIGEVCSIISSALGVIIVLSYM